MISLVDTHAHLDLPDFDTDRAAVVARGRAAGVHAIVLIGFNPERWKSTAALCAQFPMMCRSVGIHPNDSERWSSAVAAQLEHEVVTSNPIAIGEIGLDFHRDRATPSLQRQAFEAQVQLATACELPIIIHQRAAESEVLEVLERFAPLRGVMHCFSGDGEFAARCVAIGLHLGVGGVLTYPKSSAVRDGLRTVPLNRIILETDAPFLAPQPWRGKRNEPAHMLSVAETLATHLDMSVAQLASATSANASALFGNAVEQARLFGSKAVTCA